MSQIQANKPGGFGLDDTLGGIAQRRERRTCWKIKDGPFYFRNAILAAIQAAKIGAYRERNECGFLTRDRRDRVGLWRSG